MLPQSGSFLLSLPPKGRKPLLSVPAKKVHRARSGNSGESNPHLPIRALFVLR